MARTRQFDEREHHRFVSSHVREAWWDAAEDELEVRFTTGEHYRYTAVDEPTWERFKSSSSAGRFVSAVLTPNHRYREV